jgi:hypothetical protein
MTRHLPDPELAGPSSSLYPTELVWSEQGAGELALRVRTWRPVYVDRFIGEASAPDLLRLKLIPSVKELTESFAALGALRRHGSLDFQDPGVAAICIGDGRTPRTAAAIAFHSAWTCFSVDPDSDESRIAEWEAGVRRLRVLAQRIEDFREPWDGPVVIVSVHSHAPIAAACDQLLGQGLDVRMAVVVPCCGHREAIPSLDLVTEYADWGILSPERMVQVWARRGAFDTS